MASSTPSPVTGWRRRASTAACMRRAWSCWQCGRLFRSAPKELRTEEEATQKGLMVPRQAEEWRATRAVLGPLGHIEAECCEDCVAEAYGAPDFGGVQPV